MAREAGLFETTNGDIFLAYILLRDQGANIPPAWIERSTSSRKNREKVLGKLLKSKSIDAVKHIQDWHIAYRKECFYYGLRALLELERKGKTDL
jgi:hypothetical protein